MKARVATAAQGARWMAAGWRCFRAAPVAWTGVLLGCFVLLTVSSRIPLIGPPLFVVLTPALWAGFMALARAASGGQGETAAQFAASLRRGAAPLALLGVLYLVANVAAVAATIPFGEGVLADWVFHGRAPSRESLASPTFALDVALSMIFYTPAMLAFWFAPVLVTWHGMGALKALFYSFTACLIGWRAFAAYGAAVAGVFLAVFALLAVLISVLVAGLGVPPDLTVLAAMPVFALFICALIASAYASYADIFAGAGEQGGGEPG